MSALPDLTMAKSEPTQRLTLLDLVHAVNDVAEDEGEAVALVTSLLDSGRIRLVGNFREYHVSAAAVAPPRRSRR